MKIRLVFLIILLNLFIISSLVSKEKVEVVKEEQVSILIATQKSEFKDALIEQVVTELKNTDKNIFIHEIEIKELKKVEIKDYKTILIVNSLVMWRINKKVTKFMDSLSAEEKEKIVLLITAGDDKWEIKNVDKDIDTMTSASQMSKIDKLSKTIYKKLKEKT